MVKKIEYFSDVMTCICGMLLNKPPLDTASAICYFYIYKGSCGLKKEIFSKKIFYSLHGVTKTKFEESLLNIETYFEILKQKNPQVVAYIYDYTLV